MDAAAGGWLWAVRRRGEGRPYESADQREAHAPAPAHTRNGWRPLLFQAAVGRRALHQSGLRAGNGLRLLVAAAAEHGCHSGDRSHEQKRLHGSTLLPSLPATLA